MSRCHPVTAENTDVAALKDAAKTVRRRASHLATKVKNGITASANMNRAVSLGAPSGSATPSLTFPISVPPGTFRSLDTTGGVFTYTPVDDATPYKVTVLSPMGVPLLGAQYISEESPSIFLYSTSVTEGAASVTYHVRMHLDTGHTFDTSSLSLTAGPVLLPHNPRPTWPSRVGSSSSEIGSVMATGVLTLEMLKSVDGATYVPLPYPNKVGWVIPQGASAEALMLAPTPTPARGEYEVNPNAKYGRHWKNCRPAGYKKSWPYVATAKATELLSETEISRAISLIKADPRGQLLEPYVESIILDALKVVTSEESGTSGGLYLPQNGFDIRPTVGREPTPTVNVIDEGPIRRKRPKSARITPRRPEGTRLTSAGGPFQYVYATWRSYYDTYGSLLSLEPSGRDWLWEARPEAQLWLQTCYLVETLTSLTSPLRAIGVTFPPIYLSMAVYVNNLGNAYATSFINASVAEILALVNSGVMSSEEHHLACKLIWDAANWVTPPTHRQFCLRNIRKAYCNTSFMGKDPMYNVPQHLLPAVWSP